MKAIAVISPCKPAFEAWVKDRGLPGFEYKQVDSSTDLSGCQFIAIVRAKNYCLVHPDIIKAAFSRLI